MDVNKHVFSFDSAGTIGKLDTNGFLKISLVVGKLGVLPYEARLVEGFEHLPPKAAVNCLRDEDTLFAPESMASLEGMPLLIGHSVIYPGDTTGIKNKYEEPLVTIGSIAGAPERDGDLLKAKGLITNQLAIEAIQHKVLMDISPGFIRSVEVLDGLWRDEQYDVKFHDIFYNHIALLPKGLARGGKELRITKDSKQNWIWQKDVNSKQTKNGGLKMAEYVQVMTNYGNVTTDAAGSQILKVQMDALKKAEEDVKVAKDQFEGLEEKLKVIDELNAKIEALTGERDTIAAEVAAVKAELEARTSPEAMTAAMNEAGEVKEIAEGLGTDSLPADWLKFSVPELKAAIVGANLKAQGITIDSKELTVPYVTGAWTMLKHQVFEAKKAKLHVPVAGVVMDSKTGIVPGQAPRSEGAMLGYNKTDNK